MNARKLAPPLAAALLSAALHAMVITGAPGWLPPAPALPPALHARLAPLPAPSTALPAPLPESVAPPAKPKPRSAPRRVITAPAPAAPSAPRIVVEDSASTAEDAASIAGEPAAPEPEYAAGAALPEAPPEAVAIAPSTTLAMPERPPVPPLPRRGQIAYGLYLGTDRFEIGRTVQTWEVDAGRYRIGSTSETTGLAAVLRNEKRTYLSTGALTPSGLRPESFLMSRVRRGDAVVARARFDWDAGHITWGTTDDPHEGALPAGAQDFLSLLYQLAVAPPSPGRISVPLTTGTKFEVYELDVLPHETIETPLGALRALPVRQVRKPGAETIQVWLAADYRHLPVMVRFYGRDGAPTGEQIVSELRLTE